MARCRVASKKLELDLRYADPELEESRARVMRNIDDIIPRRRAPRRAAVRPASEIAGDRQPFPRFRETNAAANYNAPPLDGTRPGTLQFPRCIEYMTRLGLRSLAYHEAVPGHHFQIALQVGNEDLPRLMQIGAFSAASQP